MYFVRRFYTLTAIFFSIHLSCSAQDLGASFTPDNFVIPTMPKGLSADVSDIEIDPETGMAEFGGAITLRSDNGMKLKAANGSFNYKKQRGLLRGNIALTQKATDESYGIQIFADRAEIDHKSKMVTLNGNVSLYTGSALHRGDKAFYNYETRDMRTGIDPILLESDKFRTEEIDGEKVYIGDDAGLTTHDVENPDFWLSSIEKVSTPMLLAISLKYNFSILETELSDFANLKSKSIIDFLCSISYSSNMFFVICL